jgi:hypothetical protein
MPTHDQVVAQAVEATKKTDRRSVIRAFVGSLSSRNLPARSAFGSLMVLQKFKAHRFTPSVEFDESHCGYCGLEEEMEPETLERIEAYPFQVQHPDVQYAAFDLQTFPKRKTDQPTDDDRERLLQLLTAIRELPAKAQLTELNQSIAKAIKSNKHERMILLETFGYAGILCPATKLSYRSRFVTFDEANSDQPKEFYKREWDYPVRFWTGTHGIDEKVVATLFGDVLRDRRSEHAN